jgi:hypothetical protein
LQSNIPLLLRTKHFFGFRTVTDFEERLLIALGAALDERRREILVRQVAACNKVVRHLDPSMEPHDTFAYTEFHRTKFGRPVLEFEERLSKSDASQLFAQTTAVFREGRIYVDYWIVHGAFFSMQYRSKQRIYYPSNPYEIAAVTILHSDSRD